MLLLPSDYNIEFETFHGPFRQVEALILIQKDADQTDLIVHEDVQTLFPMHWGMPEFTQALITDNASVRDLAGEVFSEKGLATVRGLEDVLKKGRPFWLVDFDLSDRIVTDKLTPPPGWRIQLRDRYAPVYSFTKIILTRWVPSSLVTSSKY
jgi:hypothetical protein